MSNALSGLVAGFGGGYSMGRRMRKDREEDALKEGLAKANDVNPEEIEQYTPDQADQLRAAANAKDADGNALYKIEIADGGRYNVTPTAGGETGKLAPTKQYSMGGMTQTEPFSQEQVQAKKYRNKADVYSNFGHEDKAAALHGMAKAKDAEAGEVAAKTYAAEGMKKFGDLRGADKQWKELSLLAEGAANSGRWDLWKQHRDSGQALRGDLMKEAVGRADVLYRTTGSIAGYVDAHSKYALDGIHGAAIKKLDDGREEVSFGAGLDPVIIGKTDDPKARQISVATLRGMLTDPAKLAEYEQRAVERLIKRREDREDSEHKEGIKVHVIEDADGNKTLVRGSAAGQQAEQTAPGGMRNPSPKLMERHDKVLEKAFPTTIDPMTGMRTPDPKLLEARKLISDMEAYRNFGDHRLTDSDIQQAAMDVIGGRAQIKQRMFREIVPGQPDRTIAGPAVVYEDGRVIRMKNPVQAPDNIRPNIRPNIQPQSGMERASPKPNPVAFNSPELDRHAISVAQQIGLPPNLLLAIKNAGERSNNDQVSPKGAAGVMQFMPQTAKAYSVDPTDPQQAIQGAGRMMADLMKQYRGNVAAAIAHYNGGSENGRLVASGMQPNNRETREYLARVLAAMNQQS